MQSIATVLKKTKHASRRVLAKVWLNIVHQRAVQIGVTGSYGKTSTTRAIHAVISQKYSALMTDLNLDTKYNVPITALKLRAHKFIVFELGIDHIGEMNYHLEIVRPKIGVITGITPVHADIEHLGSLDNVIKEKQKLIEVLGPQDKAILNFDDIWVRKMRPFTNTSVVWYGAHNSCDYRAEDIRSDLTGLRFRIITPKQTFAVETPLLGRHNAINLLAAVAVGEWVGVSSNEMQLAFSNLEPLKGRLSIEPGPLGTFLINDALRANPASTKAGLEFLSGLKNGGRKIAVLGEMGEIGDTEIQQHVNIGQVAAISDLTFLVCVGPLTMHIAQAAKSAGFDPKHIFYAETVQQAADMLHRTIREGDILYLKGSLMRHLERIPLLLRGETVGCVVLSCPFYNPCFKCSYLEKGFSQDKYDQ